VEGEGEKEHEMGPKSTEPKGPKSILRPLKTLGPSPASLAQSSWSLLSNALGG